MEVAGAQTEMTTDTEDNENALGMGIDEEVTAVYMDEEGSAVYTEDEDSSLPVPEETQKQATRPPSVWRELGSLCIKIAAIVVVFVLVFTFFYGFLRNTDQDMDPAVKDGELVMFYRLEKNYAIGDLTLVSYQGQTQVRRVVANAGDTVDITDAGLVVNGALQQESEIFQPTRRYDSGISFPLTVGPGQVFVLGDARTNATDSRVYGPVDKKNTLGKVITVIRWRQL